MNIAVYCSSRSGLPEQYVSLARRVGQWIGEHGHTLVYGGSNAGLMHEVAAAAKEAGGRVVGIMPRFFEHMADPVLDECELTTDFVDRKQRMIELAHHFVVLPGGIGTIEEWITTLSHLLIACDTRRRIVVANLDGIYDPQVSQLELTARSPMVHGDHMAISLVATTTEQVIERLNDLTQITK